MEAPNTAVLAFLKKALAQTELRVAAATSIHEFDGCQYHLLRTLAAPDVVRLSFKTASPLAPAAEAAVASEYAGSAAALTDPESGFQVTLQVRIACMLRRACFTTAVQSLNPHGAMWHHR